MSGLELIKKALDNGYITQKEYDNLAKLKPSQIKHKIKSRKWVATEGKGNYLFRELSPEEFERVLRQRGNLSPPEVRDSDVKTALRRRYKDVIQKNYNDGLISYELFNDAQQRYIKTFGAETVKELKDALQYLKGEQFGESRRYYSVEYARDVGIDVDEARYNSDLDYRNDINTEIKYKVQSEGLTTSSAQRISDKKVKGPGSTIASQEELLRRSPQAFSRELAKSGYRSWLKHNKDAPIQSPNEWWKTLSAGEKSEWERFSRPIQEYNNSVYRRHHAQGVIAPSSDLIQAHHILPKSYKGAHTPSNMAAALGDAMSDATEHFRLHGRFRLDSPVNKLYKYLSDIGATEYYYAPTGSGGIKSKWIKNAAGEVTGIVPGLDEYHYDLRVDPFRGAGTSNAPAHKFNIFNMWRNNPKKAAAASILVPAASLYSMVSKGDIPEGLLNRPKEERFLGTRRADDLWQSGKHHVFKPGGWMDWFSLIDPYDLALHGRAPRRYDTSLSLQERKMVDPTWSSSTAINTPPKKKRENIWT